MQVPTMWNAARTSIARALSFQIHSDSAPTFVPSNPECMSPSSSPLSAGDDVCGEEKSLIDFLRLKRGVVGGDGFELQTAIVSYGKRLQPNSIQVDLVAAIHIADKQHYEILQRELESYDCVLYEMIKYREIPEEDREMPEEDREIPEEDREMPEEDREIPEEDSMISKATRGQRIIQWMFERCDDCMFQLMTRVLSLHFQLRCIDYEHGNWQNADLDYETFELLKREKGEDFFRLTFKQLEETIQAPEPCRISKPLRASPMASDCATSQCSITSACSPSGTYNSSEYSVLEALSKLDIGGAAKIFLAKQILSRSNEELISAIEEESVILGERNRVAIEALRKKMDDGHRRIAVFYGAGHMPDLERRLRQEFDMVPCQVRWVTAWSIRRRESTVSSAFFQNLAWLLGNCRTIINSCSFDFWSYSWCFNPLGYCCSQEIINVQLKKD